MIIEAVYAILNADPALAGAVRLHIIPQGMPRPTVLVMLMGDTSTQTFCGDANVQTAAVRVEARAESQIAMHDLGEAVSAALRDASGLHRLAADRPAFDITGTRQMGRRTWAEQPEGAFVWQGDFRVDYSEQRP